MHVCMHDVGTYVFRLCCIHVCKDVCKYVCMYVCKYVFDVYGVLKKNKCVLMHVMTKPMTVLNHVLLCHVPIISR